jgi:hypothetical protein
VTLARVKCASKPLSQNCAMDRRALLWRSAKTCAWRAASGRAGRSSRAVCVERMTAPLGRRTGMPLVVEVLLTQWLSARRKWAVQPESAQAWGGDGWEYESVEGLIITNLLMPKLVLRHHHSFPRMEPPMGAALVAAVWWPVAGLVHELLVWRPPTLYPCVQQ